MSQPPDRIRRRLLARFGLGMAMAYAAPVVTGIGTARASGGSGASGASGASRGGQDGRRDPGAPPQRRRRVVRPAPPPPPPELVLYLPDAGAADALSAANYAVLQQTPLATGQLYRLGLPPGRDAATALAELAQLFPAGVADRNTLYSPDEFLCEEGSCSAHAVIGWAGWPSAMAPRIGMIDTGINADHAALAGQKLIIRASDLGERTAAGRQHGTAVAALLIGAMDSRTPGLLPYAELHAAEAFHLGTAGEAADAYALAEAMDHLIGAGVSVINLSFSGPENAVLHALVRRAVAQGVGLVAAAGNDGPGAPPAFPAAWPEVIAVTAVDAGLQPYRQANRGPYVTLAAPGVNLWTAASVSGGRLRSGTSYAAPFVTAVLAVERARSPALDLTAQIARVVACARDLGAAGHDDIFGNGLVSTPDQCLATDAVENPEIFGISGE